MQSLWTRRASWPGWRLSRAIISATALGLVGVFGSTLPADADWLITLEGRMIETQGPWTIEDDVLTYTDLEGQQHTLNVDDVDIEASEETTALKAGKEYVPRSEREVSSEEAKKARKKLRKKAKVILYMTTLCRDCSRAKKLLEELDVNFIEKDINANRNNGREYRRKAGHGGGLPVIDIDGTLVFSNNPRVIRQRVEEFKERERKAAGSTGKRGRGHR